MRRGLLLTALLALGCSEPSLPLGPHMTPWRVGMLLTSHEWRSGGKGWAIYNGRKVRVRMYYRLASASRPYSGEPASLCVTWVYQGRVVAYSNGPHSWPNSCRHFGLARQPWQPASFTTEGWDKLPPAEVPHHG